MKKNPYLSPNFSNKIRSKKDIKFVVIHYTGMQSEIESIKRLLDKNSKVSCHYLINRKGKIFKMVPDIKIAWHAGKSKWKEFKNLNENSIGIELVNKGHLWGFQKYTTSQIKSLINLCKKLKKTYKIKNSNFLGHSDISPTRKIDPGEKFPWKKLANYNLCKWHKLSEKKIMKCRNLKVNKSEKKLFFNNLRIIGYLKLSKKNEKSLINAFQRRFRQDLINGKIDKECLLISKNLLKS